MGRGFGKGLGGFGDMAKLLKQAQQMQQDMQAAQDEIEKARVQASSGGGVVTAVVSGKGQLISLELKPEAVDPDDVEMLQDLIITAVREAQEQANELTAARMQGLAAAAGLPPGLV